MIWVISFILGLILIGVATKVLLTPKYGKLRYAFTCIILAVASIVLYCPYFFHKYNLLSAVLGNIFNVMQLVSLDADFYGVCELAREHIKFALFEDLYICLLAIIHIALPTVALLTAYNIIAYCAAHAKLLKTKFTNEDIFVFSCCTKKAELLAKDIHANHGKKATYIFAGNMEGSEIDTLTSDSMSCIFCDEDITGIKIKSKKKRNVYYFNMADDDENLNNALALVEKYAGSDLQRNIHIFIFLVNNENDILVDASNKGNMNIRIVDQDQVSVYELLDKKPIYTVVKNDTISFLIAGFDRCGEELLKSAIWCGQMDGIKLKINVIAENVQSKREKLLFKYPEILCPEYNINFHEARLDEDSLSELLLQNCMDTTYVAVTNGCDEGNLKLAIYLRRFFLRNDPDFENMPFIAAKIKSAEKYEVIKNIATPEFSEARKAGYDIYPFGNDRCIYSYKELVEAPLEKLAQNVHLTYEDIFNDSGEIDATAALARYNVFEVKKRSNRANAMHIRYKLWLLGLDYSDDENDDEVELSDYLGHERLQKLTEMEHNRWMAFLRTEGWAAASIDETEKYKEISKGRHECPVIKLHPYICAFEDLERYSCALGLPDATIYDKELIVRIPDILHDKWGVTGKRYRIIKGIKGE